MLTHTKKRKLGRFFQFLFHAIFTKVSAEFQYYLSQKIENSKYDKLNCIIHTLAKNTEIHKTIS